MAGLLTCPGFMKPSHPTFIKASNGQWQGIIKPSSLERSGITAAGTVADFYRIPFSSQLTYLNATPKHGKDMN
jgi:hypothetical protein